MRIGKEIREKPQEVYETRLRYWFVGYFNAKDPEVKVQCLRQLRMYAKALRNEIKRLEGG